MKQEIITKLTHSPLACFIAFLTGGMLCAVWKEGAEGITVYGICLVVLNILCFYLYKVRKISNIIWGILFIIILSIRWKDFTIPNLSVTAILGLPLLAACIWGKKDSKKTKVAMLLATLLLALHCTLSSILHLY